MSGASTAAHGAAAAVKEAQIDSALARGLMQFVLRFVQFPGAGQHASVFIGVGVAEHDFVGAPPGVEERLKLGELARRGA